LLFYLAALQNGRVSVIATLTALYPMVTIFLAALVLKERVTFNQYLGMGLAIVAILLMVYE
jgi:transporter family protein